MKRLRLLGILMVASTVSVSGSAMAEPAWVLIGKGDVQVCSVIWIDTDYNFVSVPGYYGTNVITNNGGGKENITCHVDYDWSQPMIVINPATGLYESRWLASLDQVCALLGLCRNGGAMILNHENTGGYCGLQGGITTKWQRTISPSGQETFHCSLPD